MYSVPSSCSGNSGGLALPSRGSGDNGVKGIDSGLRGSGVSGGMSRARDVSYEIVVRMACSSMMMKSRKRSDARDGTWSDRNIMI